MSMASAIEGSRQASLKLACHRPVLPWQDATEEGRMDQQQGHGLLTAAEIDALPEALRGYYRTHAGLRDLDDLPFFPEAKRVSLEQMLTRLQERTL
jgi:hypothetical protein